MSRAEDSHEQAQHLSAHAASLALRAGPHRERAVRLYARAARLEGEAYRQVPSDKPRTRWLLGLSYVSLLYKGELFREAEVAAATILGDLRLSPAERSEMKTLLEAIWEEETAKQEGLRFSGEEVEVALREGPVGSGTAPVDLALHTMSIANNFSYRLVEWSEGRQFRTRGAVPRDLVEHTLEARATQPSPGSYRFRIRFMEPRQKSFLTGRTVDPTRVAKTFVDLARAVAEGDEKQVAEIVPEQSYRLALAKLSRNMIPAPASRTSIEIRRSGDSPLRIVRLQAGQREQASRVVRALLPKPPTQETTLRGILRALDLNGKWVSIDLDSGNTQKCLAKPGVVLDDVVGPMVNKRVIARITKRAGLPRLHDIDFAE